MIEKPDGEVLTSDKPSEAIPHASTWDNLSFSQLTDLKNKLMGQAWKLNGQQALKKTLEQSIERLTSLISSKQ